ncbi:MAG: transposase [Polyangiaceae bacterium]|nr:transposase [Polyangiaceae bacterium]
MDRYIGLDAHSQTCTFAVMGSAGRQLREQTLETNAKVLIDFVRTIPGQRRLCMEEGTLSEWLCEVLEPHVAELVVVQPDKHAGAKNDPSMPGISPRSSARATSRTSFFKARGRFTQLREAVRAHRVTTADVVRTKLRLNALYRSRGIHGMGNEIYDPDTRDQWLPKLPPARARMAQLLSTELDGLCEVREQAEIWLLEQAREHAEVRRLTTLPGIGPVRAAYIVAIVVTPFRFSTKRDFFGYCGLGIVTRSSSDYERDERSQRWVRRQVAHTRGLNRNRNPLLKAIFKGAALSVIAQTDHPLRRDYDRLLQNSSHRSPA